MTSLAPPTLVWFYKEWEKLVDYPSATFSGIVPDATHLQNGGKHVSIEDLIRFGNAGDYSNTLPLDKAPPVTKPDGTKQSAAVDVSLSKTDMVKLYGRVKKVFDDRTDPRRKWIGWWNAWNGVVGNLPDRFNFQTNTMGTTDRSHEWHSHDDHPRAYVDEDLNGANCWTAVRAALSIVKGETIAQWLASEEGISDMPSRFTFEDFPDNPPVATPGGPSRIHITDGLRYIIQQYSNTADKLKTSAGFGPVINLTPTNTGFATYATAVGVYCGKPDPGEGTVDVDALAAAIVAALPAMPNGLTQDEVTIACIKALEHLKLGVVL
jgi:hypothetical protein